MKRCFSCFRSYQDELGFCPHCGQPEILNPVEPIHLLPGTILHNRYILGLSINSGGFGIVYKAWDLKLERVVAVKEFYVSRLVVRAGDMKRVSVSKKSSAEFNYRKERFLAEARNMAKFERCENIPDVIEFFEENETAYIVMELLVGLDLKKYLEQDSIQGCVSTEFAVAVSIEVAKALKELHKENIIHRDVAPDNIYICAGKGLNVKLIDLGAAKLGDSTDDVIDIILKPGYSPPEQYDNTKNIGSWSDIYALGATMYLMLTGVKPEESTNRKDVKNDPIVPPKDINPSIPENLNNIIMRALAVEKHLRFKTADEFIKALEGNKFIDPPKVLAKKKKTKRMASIAAACLVIALIFGIVLNSYNNIKKADVLKPADITVWVIKNDYNGLIKDDKNSTSKKVSDWCTNNFNKQEGNNEVTVSVVEVDAVEYEEKLITALRDKENAPDIFESTIISDDVINQYAASLDDVIKSSEFKKCDLLNSYYDKVYISRNKIPLAVNIPMIYDLSGKNKSRCFKSIGEFDDIVSDINGTSLFINNGFKDISSANIKSIIESKTFSDNVLLSSSERFEAFNKINMTNESVNVSYVFPDYDGIYSEFTFEWSINRDSSENNMLASKKLMRYMLEKAVIEQICWYKIPVSSDAISDNFKKNVDVNKLYSKLIFEVK